MKLKKIGLIFLCVLMINNVSCIFAEDNLEKALTTEEINKIVKNKNNEYGTPNKYWNEEIGEFIIPDGYKKISEAAFPSDRYAEYVINKIAKERCLIQDIVKRVVLPDSIKYIDEGAFSGSPIKEIILSKNLQYIGGGSFSETDIREIKWPKSVEKIEEGMFAYGNLEKIEIPDTVTEIGNFSFLGTRLTEIYIPDSVIEIGENTFYDCGSLKKVKLPVKLEKIKNALFWRNAFEEIEIPDNVKEIEDTAFAGCQLKELKLPRGLTKVGDSVFWYCEQLERIEMPGVKELGKYVFSNCDKLKELVVSKEFFKSEGISKEAFEGSPDEFYDQKGEKVKDKSVDVYVEDGIEGINIEEIKRENKWIKSIKPLTREEEESKKIPETGMDKENIMMISMIIGMSMMIYRLKQKKNI